MHEQTEHRSVSEEKDSFYAMWGIDKYEPQRAHLLPLTSVAQEH